MVKVRLYGVTLEDAKKEIFKDFGQPNTRWCGLVALNLYEQQEQQPLAEWFYLVACSEMYKNKPFRDGPVLDSKYVIVQKRFNIDEIERLARQRVENVEADNWDQFYEQMEQVFLHED